MNTQPLALIIEDDEDLSIIFSEALSAAGYAYEIVRDGRAAIEMLSALTPQIVILDLHLPFVAGTEILAWLRSTEQFKDTRVVVTTADARLAEETEEDADVVLIKPISFSELRGLTSRFLNLTCGESL